MKTLTYDVIEYDAWGNEEDGYYVNAAYFTERTVDLPDSATDSEIVRALKDAGEIKSEIPADRVGIQGDLEFSLYIEDNENGRPEFELRRREEE